MYFRSTDLVQFLHISFPASWLSFRGVVYVLRHHSSSSIWLSIKPKTRTSAQLDDYTSGLQWGESCSKYEELSWKVRKGLPSEECAAFRLSSYIRQRRLSRTNASLDPFRLFRRWHARPTRRWHITFREAVAGKTSLFAFYQFISNSS